MEVAETVVGTETRRPMRRTPVFIVLLKSPTHAPTLRVHVEPHMVGGRKLEKQGYPG